MRNLIAAVVTVVVFAGPAFAQSTECVSIGANGLPAPQGGFGRASISGDGRYVAFATPAALDPSDTNGVMDVYVRDRVAQSVTRASVSTLGVQADKLCAAPVLSADGRFVAFMSEASTLQPAPFVPLAYSVFVRDLQAGTTELASGTPSGSAAGNSCFPVAFTPNGRFLLFSTSSQFVVPNDTTNSYDLFVRDRLLGVTEGISVGVGGLGEGNDSDWASISDDGRYVAYRGYKPAMEGGPALLHDRGTKTTVVMSVGPQGPFDVKFVALSGDGSTLAFSTTADLLPSDTISGQFDLYVRDLATNQLELVGVDTAGLCHPGESVMPRLSFDGRFVAFRSTAPLVASDADLERDVYLRDRATSKTLLASVATDGTKSNGRSEAGFMTRDGRTIVFANYGSNLVPGDTNATSDVFVHDFASPATVASYGSGFPGTNGVVPSLVLSAPPVLGTTPVLRIENSSGAATVGLLLLGATPQSVVTSALGTLLVVPAVTVAIPIAANGASVPGKVHDDLTLAGLAIYAQVVEIDPGAAAGVSFTPGLEMHLGS